MAWKHMSEDTQLAVILGWGSCTVYYFWCSKYWSGGHVCWKLIKNNFLHLSFRLQQSHCPCKTWIHGFIKLTTFEVNSAQIPTCPQPLQLYIWGRRGTVINSMNRIQWSQIWGPLHRPLGQCAYFSSGTGLEFKSNTLLQEQFECMVT